MIPARPFAQKGITFKRLLQNLAWEGVPGPHLMPNFTVVALKTWVYSPESPKLVFFWYKFAQIFAQISPKQF